MRQAEKPMFLVLAGVSRPVEKSSALGSMLPIYEMQRIPSIENVVHDPQKRKWTPNTFSLCNKHFLFMTSLNILKNPGGQIILSLFYS